ncbi:NADP-dependent oxidoreductase [Serratia marcescens]|nr:NADP-dependent oxidoreductase [Serratia marcescens]HAT3674486.1 NADP-dependent oxidoreductase [Serratia marcescens]
MKTVVVDEFGELPHIAQCPVPQPAPDEIRIKMYAASINPLDWRIAGGMLKDRLPHIFPLVLGIDGMGVIDAIGESVTRFQIGDHVVGRFLFNQVGKGSFSEYQTLSQNAMLVTVPKAIFTLELASLPTAAVTAFQLCQLVNVPVGSKVMIVGAAGGVGSFATQMLARRGYQVIAVAGGKHADYLKSIGAKDIIDYHNGPVIRQLLRRHPDKGAGIIDLINNSDDFIKNLSWINEGGIAISSIHAARAGDADNIPTINFELSPDISSLKAVLHMQENGEFNNIKVRTILLEDVPASLQQSKLGQGTGKTIVTFS